MRTIQAGFRFVSIATLLLLNTRPASAQTQAGPISLIDKSGTPTASITDGNQIALGYALGAPVEVQTQVLFLLDGGPEPVAGCTVTAGERTCTSVSFDSLGWYWSKGGEASPVRTVQALVDGELQLGELSVEVIPRPVVMVHGFLSSWHAWDSYLGPQGYLTGIGLRGFAVGDGQADGQLQTGTNTNPGGRTNTIAQNAEVLSQYIAGVQQATGAEKVDLLVHSMGGMISRYYLDSVMKDRNVAQLIILGTPNAGSDCASMVAALGFYLPASLEILPSYMTGVFNTQVNDRRGVPFHALAGTRLVDPVSSPCTSVPSDMVVSTESLEALPMDVVTRPLLHSDLPHDPEIFGTFVRPLLEAPPGGVWTAPQPDAAAVAPDPLQFSRVYVGHVPAGGSQPVTINIDPNVALANFALYDSSRSLDISVQGASGNVINLDPVTNGEIRIDDPETMVYLGYGFNQPRPGQWVITLNATDATPPSGADFGLTAKYKGGAALDAGTSTTLANRGEAITLTARLKSADSALPLESADALIRRPDGSTETVALHPQGNDFAAQYTPRENGVYGVEVRASAKVDDGFTVDRASFLTFQVQPVPALPGRAWLTLSGLVLACCLAFAGCLALIVVGLRVMRRGKDSGKPA